ncbi:hypothetical protein [uncultured Methanobrevibacter sp.]|uniref:hypothetical protein n=1 Tax=uncultured Methanobrevibacter sp. TaxID=253161 RepID=UPI0025DEBE49|nr:hypothetical protein [uncultured Methanobrevibacter sp.]
MKVNKTILVGFILIVFSGIIFVTDAFNPIIRPITYIFLMGSSKGKDIMFFFLLGIFLILSQTIKKEIDSTRYLKISIIIGSILLILGILIEILFRLQMGIALNNIFASMNHGMSTTSILHTHLLKSILGEILTAIMGPFIQSNINTGVGLYSYVPNFAKLVILLIPILFVTCVLASQKRPWPTNFILAVASSCLIIGAIDGGMFGTPAIVGICGLYLVYRNGYYTNCIMGFLINDKNLLEKNEEIQPPYKVHSLRKMRDLFNLSIYLFVIGGIILLRFTVAFAGAEPDYYTVEIANMEDNVTFGKIPLEKISQTKNITTYHVTSEYNEMELLNDLKVPLNNSCEYYTVSWNIYSYLD